VDGRRRQKSRRKIKNGIIKEKKGDR